MVDKKKLIRASDILVLFLFSVFVAPIDRWSQTAQECVRVEQRAAAYDG
jgi:hypothetical protein